jgi:hypothetical protein
VEYEQELQETAGRVLSLARQSLAEALEGLDELENLVGDQRKRIKYLETVIESLSRFESEGG